MKVGVSLTSRHVVDDPREGARWMIERAAAARRAGLDSLFIGDHHATPEPYYQNTPMLGRLLAEWDDKPAGCLFLLPLWHPTLLAEQVGTLAAIAKGRFIMQVGLGYGEDQFAAMGTTQKARVPAFEEALDVVRRLLAGETVTNYGRFSLAKARISPIPAEPVEVWFGAGVPVAIDRAARLGDAWLASPSLSVDKAREQLNYYRERCAAHGRRPTALAIRRDVYVGESSAEAKAVLAEEVAKGYRGFPPDALVAGTVDEVTERFAELARLGYTEVLIRHLTDDRAKVLGSFARLARVRQAVAAL
ncbi:MAG TPA: LLM class flavin-dependent oxidoreductase [Candidatus Acidoferrum sp.]|nr:LLM class flavin-dependent oxidoreductase [Candidatus Acidoferrum sp.]